MRFIKAANISTGLFNTAPLLLATSKTLSDPLLLFSASLRRVSQHMDNNSSRLSCVFITARSEALRAARRSSRLRAGQWEPLMIS